MFRIFLLSKSIGLAKRGMGETILPGLTYSAQQLYRTLVRTSAIRT